MKIKLLLAISFCSAARIFSLHAEQSGSGHYISGEYADFCGMPPAEPGFYLGNYFLDYANARVAGNKELPFGGILGAGIKANTQAEAPLAIYAFPFNLDHITFSTGIAVPIMSMDVKANATYNRNNIQISGARSQYVWGLGDIQLMPVMAAWTNGDFSVGGMCNIWAPSGDYDTGQLANLGLGYWTFEPMLSFAWLSSKIGTELSVFSAVDFNTENTDANYQSGDIFHVDATLAQHLPLFGGIAGAGASAFYLKQFTGDSGDGARLGSFMAESYGVGPTISYVHKVGKTDLVVDGSWLPQLHVEKTLKGNFFWLKATLVF